MKIILTFVWVLMLYCVMVSVANAQSIKMRSLVAGLNLKNSVKFDSYSADLGASINNLNGMHGITYKLSFDSKVIYADSINILANNESLGLLKDEYYEMQRIDSSFVLYSLTLKGRNRTLKLDDLPIVVNFVIRPETYYNLIANNCEYTIEFKAESVTAYDNNKVEIELSPFVLPIELECEKNGESKLLLAAPNPTKERCWIHLPTNRTQDVETLVLFNTAGKQQSFSSQINDDEIELNLGCLLAGHYYLNIIYKNHNNDIVKIVKL